MSDDNMKRTLSKEESRELSAVEIVCEEFGYGRVIQVAAEAWSRKVTEENAQDDFHPAILAFISHSYNVPCREAVMESESGRKNIDRLIDRIAELVEENTRLRTNVKFWVSQKQQADLALDKGSPARRAELVKVVFARAVKTWDDFHDEYEQRDRTRPHISVDGTDLVRPLSDENPEAYSILASSIDDQLARIGLGEDFQKRAMLSSWGKFVARIKPCDCPVCSNQRAPTAR